MVRGRRQNPDAPPSRQLEISRAFRKRKANDLQILRDRADRLERENVDLRRENERLRILLKRPTNGHYDHSSNHRIINTINENGYNGLFHANHDRTNSMPSNVSRRGEDLIQNIQDHWSFQTGFDSGSSYNYPIQTNSTSDGSMNQVHINQQQNQQSIGNLLPNRQDASVLRISTGSNGNSRNSAVSQPSEPSMQSPQSSTTQSFQVVDLRPETQMGMLDSLRSVHTDADETEQNATEHDHSHQEQHQGHSTFDQTTYAASQQDQQSVQHANDHESAQRLWELAVRANGGDTDRCCAGLFECDDQGRIKVETPPHIAYPA